MNGAHQSSAPQPRLIGWAAGSRRGGCAARHRDRASPSLMEFALTRAAQAACNAARATSRPSQRVAMTSVALNLRAAALVPKLIIATQCVRRECGGWVSCWLAHLRSRAPARAGSSR